MPTDKRFTHNTAVTSAAVADVIAGLKREVRARWATVWLAGLVDPPVLAFATPGFRRDAGWAGDLPDAIAEAAEINAPVVRRARVMPLRGLAAPIPGPNLRPIGFVYCERRQWTDEQAAVVESGARRLAPALSELLGYGSGDERAV